jgi:UDP-glucose 4-epimerase
VRWVPLEIGEDHDPETHLLPLILDVAAMRGVHITILGNDCDVPGDTCVRDNVHVSDLADGHVRALDYLLAGGRTTAWALHSNLRS